MVLDNALILFFYMQLSSFSQLPVFGIRACTMKS